MGRKFLGKSIEKRQEEKAKWTQQIRLNKEKYEERKNKDRDYRRRQREQKKSPKDFDFFACLADRDTQELLMKGLEEEFDRQSIGAEQEKVRGTFNLSEENISAGNSSGSYEENESGSELIDIK
jgi:hypothetical protein